VPNLLYFLIFIFFVGCGPNVAEKTATAIDVALTHLSNEECDDAIDVLEEAGYQSSNGIYLQVLASAYACKAGFREVDFLLNDLAVINTASFPTIMKSLSIMTLSDETTVDSADYTAIGTGLSVLLQSTSGSPSQVSRESKFGTRRAGDMGIQALMLGLVNLGKFIHLYGNASTSGVKGGGSNSPSNSCFLNYTDLTASGIVINSGLTGACTTATDGHASLDRSTAPGIRRLCEGLVLFTNILDILENLNISSNSQLSALNQIATQVAPIKIAAMGAGLGALISMTSQSDCETAMASDVNLNKLEQFYVAVYEKGLL
jgi:hypothetical protein